MQTEFESILTAAQAGADWAWRKIYDDLHGTLVGYFRVQGAGDPEALASDVLLRLARSISGFSGSYDRFRSWVFTVAHNRLIDDRRQKGRRVTQVAADANHEPVGGDVETEAMQQISNEWVRSALDILTPDQREVIGLRILGGFTIGQIAEITHKRPGAVKAAQRRGLKRIAEWHDRNPYPSDDTGRLPD